MKKIRKFSIFILAILTSLFVFQFTPVYAGTFANIKSAADDFINRGQNNTPISMSEAGALIGSIGPLLLGIGILVILITGLIIGIKYMISGSDEKAKLKEILIWWVIAAVVVFGAISITNIIIRIMNNVTG